MAAIIRFEGVNDTLVYRLIYGGDVGGQVFDNDMGRRRSKSDINLMIRKVI